MPRILARFARPLLVAAAFASTAQLGCKPKSAVDEKFNADAQSGPDGNRTGANKLQPNKPVTDQVNFLMQDKTDWFVIGLQRVPGKAQQYLNTLVRWDSDKSDVQLDIYDPTGKNIASTPTRDKGRKDKALLTQIDNSGTYYIRVTAPAKDDATVYTLEAQWEEPKPEDISFHVEQPEEPPVKTPKKREPREPKPEVEKPAGDTIQGRIVQAYRDDDGWVLQIDKGSAQGVKSGMSGTILDGASGEAALDGGDFKVFQIVSPGKCLARTHVRSVGKSNNRVSITK